MDNTGFAFTSNPYKNFRRMVLWAKRNLDPGKHVDWSGGIRLTKRDDQSIYADRSNAIDLPNFHAKVSIMIINYAEGRSRVTERLAAMRQIRNFSKGKSFPLP